MTFHDFLKDLTIKELLDLQETALHEAERAAEDFRHVAERHAQLIASGARKDGVL